MTTIRLTAATTKKPEWAMAQPVDFTLETGEHIAIVGRNAAGKSMLVDMITGRHPVFPGMVEYHFNDNSERLVSENIRYITFRDTYGGDNDRTYFLQQRWNQMEIDEETPTVGSKLEEAYQLAGSDTPERRQLQQHLYELFHITPLLDKYLILLSSGELRKFKLASSLFGNPRVFIMDNPFIGLDAETRDQVRQLLTMLSREQQLQIILVLSKTDEIPDFITHVVEVDDMTVLPKVTRSAYLDSRTPTPTAVLSEEKRQLILSLPHNTQITHSPHHSHQIIAFNDVLELIMGPKVFGGNAGEEPAIVKKGENVWEIDARASLEEVNRELDLELEAEDADRLSGWVTFHAERIPHVGQEIEADGCRATVLKRRGRRVTLVKFEVLSRPTTTSDEELIEETDAAVERTEEDDA
jgi:ABC-type multidrug transport system ATPase subunit